MHQITDMRLSINLGPEPYALAKAEDCPVSAAVNRLLRRSLPGAQDGGANSKEATAVGNGFVIARGRKVVTAETVKQAEGGGRPPLIWLLDGNVLARGVGRRPAIP